MATIGILAGMGPKSTGPFIDEVISQFQQMTGARDDLDFPPIIIYSLPTPFYLDRSIDHAAMKKTICEGLRRLESFGVSFIAMPCNTAHLYFEALERCTRVPLLNMIDLTVASIPSTAKKVTLMGTRPTIESELYQKALRQKNFEYILHPQWQKQIDAIIAHIKTEKNPSNHLLDPLFAEFKAAGIDTLLLVCTDLNVLFRHMNGPFEELSPKRGRDGLRHETCLRPSGVLLTQHRMLRISPTDNGRQVPCRKSVDSSANSAVNVRDCARAAVQIVDSSICLAKGIVNQWEKQ